MLRALRVALLRHRDAADHAVIRRLGQLGDLGPLEVVDLVADLRERAGDEREQGRELGHPVARGRPADLGDAEPEPLQDAPLELEPLRSPRRQRADGAGDLADGEPRLRLRKALAVARQLGRPHGRLEAERDRQPRLPVRAPEHHRCRGDARRGRAATHGSCPGPARRSRACAASPARSMCRSRPGRSGRGRPTPSRRRRARAAARGSARASSARCGASHRPPPRGRARARRARRSRAPRARGSARARPGPSPAHR